MRGKMRGGRRGRRGVEGYVCPCRLSGHPSGVRTRSRAKHSLVSTSDLVISTPTVPLPVIHQQHSSSVAISNDEAVNSSPAVEENTASVEHKIDPQATNSRFFSSVNVTEFAQKLQEDDPEEEVESALEPGFDYVNGHRVKIQYAPLAKAIFQRYGDITIGSRIKSPAILSLHIEFLCFICKKLEETKLFDVSVTELEKTLAEVEDLVSQNMNVGWLRDRIEAAIKTQIDAKEYMAVQEENRKCDTIIERLEEEVSLTQQHLCALRKKLEEEKVKSDMMKKFALDVRGRVAYHRTHSLLHDLF